MKRTITVLTLALSLLISNAAPFFPGAWYATKQTGLKQAGAVEVFFFEGEVVEMDIYLGGTYLETADGAFQDAGKYFTFTVTDSDGWIWSGKLNKATGQLLGSFTTAGNRTKGKFQASRMDDGTTVE